MAAKTISFEEATRKDVAEADAKRWALEAADKLRTDAKEKFKGTGVEATALSLVSKLLAVPRKRTPKAEGDKGSKK